MLHKFKTKRKSDTRDPSWNETFVLDPAVPVHQLKLRLTVWDHDLGGVGNDRWGQVELRLEDATLLKGAVQAMRLQSLPGKNGHAAKAAKGDILFSLKAEGCGPGNKVRRSVRMRLRSFVRFAARGR